MLDKESVEQQALALIAQDGSNVAPRLAVELGISRQAVNAHLRRLVDKKLVTATGSTRARVYSLAILWEETRDYHLEGLSEDLVWRESFAPKLADLPFSVRDIWHYGVTEMVNNAIDHSEGSQLKILVQGNAHHACAQIKDDGVGIFHKIQLALGLYDPRESILELAKGKFTTDPARHSGEGIFFASKLFDEFAIMSGGLHFQHDHGQADILKDGSDDVSGTVVRLQLANQSQRIMQEVFDRFAAPEEYSFAETVVPVHLAQYEGEKLVSRSQAKRLYQRFERFKRVVLDFTDVAEIGQAFADELFRVFAKSHPEVDLQYVNLTDAVERMIKRALSVDA